MDNETKAEFLGGCMGVRLVPRDETGHILFEVLVEDDELWHKKMSVSSSWLDELIDKLVVARNWIKDHGEPDLVELAPGNTRQFGWKFKP